VINLSDDKEKALSEAYRVIKEGGRLAISDIISIKQVPDEIRKVAELWVGCIAGSRIYQSCNIRYFKRKELPAKDRFARNFG